MNGYSTHTMHFAHISPRIEGRSAGERGTSGEGKGGAD